MRCRRLQIKWKKERLRPSISFRLKGLSMSPRNHGRQERWIDEYNAYCGACEFTFNNL
jgi:hypothetical protein